MITPDDFKGMPPLTRRDHIAQLLHTTEDFNGLVLELGVFRGDSIKLIADLVKPKTVHGFDSWEGLPEPWHVSDGLTRPAGHFTLGVNATPALPCNVHMHKGWFNETVPLFGYSHRDQSIRFLHVDCDLYSSTIGALIALNELIVPGTVIAFDELFNWEEGNGLYTKWRDGEYRALHRWMDVYNRKVSPMLRNNEYGASVCVYK